MLFVQQKGIQTMEWVGGAAMMTMGMLRSVRITVTACITVLST